MSCEHEFDYTCDDCMTTVSHLEPDSVDANGNQYDLYAEYQESQGFSTLIIKEGVEVWR